MRAKIIGYLAIQNIGDTTRFFVDEWHVDDAGNFLDRYDLPDISEENGWEKHGPNWIYERKKEQ